jgi:RNA-binding protein YlmH
MEAANVAQLVVTPSVLPIVLESLTRVADIPVTVTPMPLPALLVKRRSVKEISTVEASLRLDAGDFIITIIIII